MNKKPLESNKCKSKNAASVSGELGQHGNQISYIAF